MSEMNAMHFQNLDLNLLKVFDSVMSERSVTRAAKRLNLTQGAVSHALARLRSMTGDQLFVRTRDGMRPTARAFALSGPIREALSVLEGALSTVAFDPGRSNATFRLAATDYFMTLALPQLVRRIEREAQGMSLRFISHTVSNVPELLEKQEVDLAVGFFQNSLRNMLPAHCEWETLWEDHLECVMRREHPLAARELDLDAYLSARHLQFSVGADASSTVDRFLQKKNVARKVVLIVSQYLGVGAILESSDLIMTVPGRIARLLEKERGLFRTAIPIRLPAAPTQLVWSGWTSRSASHAWLRSLISEVCAEV